MMPTNKQIFLKQARKKANDQAHFNTVNHNLKQYHKAVEKGRDKYQQLEKAKELLSQYRQQAIRNSANLLIEFEQQALKNGSSVHWAKTKEKAQEIILDICLKERIKKIVKSKSMTTEEIELNPALESKGITAIETDLGEFIVQLAEQKPYHILTPAMHLSHKDIAKLFHKHFQTPLKATPEELTRFARQQLRHDFLNADAAITGANFLLADIGGMALIENEGNGIFGMFKAKTHIVVAGIDKIIAKASQLADFWPILAQHGTGQALTAYNSIIKKAINNNIHFVLIDNGRSKLLAQTPQNQALKCIRCGACLNACPVYRHIGGHTYNSTYSGPIGSVLTPFYQGVKEFGHLSFASTLCGKCNDVCPVNIKLNKLLLNNRKQFIEKKQNKAIEKTAMTLFQYVMMKSKRLKIVNHLLANKFINHLVRRSAGKNRLLPPVKIFKSPDTLNKQ